MNSVIYYNTRYATLIMMGPINPINRGSWSNPANQFPLGNSTRNKLRRQPVSQLHFRRFWTHHNHSRIKRLWIHRFLHASNQ